MKILYISEDIFPSAASRSLSIMKMCQAFHDAGHHIILLGRRSKKGEENVFSYYGLPGRFSIRTFFISNQNLIQSLAYGRKVKSVATKEKPYVVYSRLCLLPLLFIPKNMPVVYEMHSPGYIGKSYIKRILFEYIILSRKKLRIIATTDLLKRYLLERYPNLDITVARLSAEEPIEMSGEEIKEFKKKNIPESSNNFKVGFTGFLDNKGLRGGELICEIARTMKHIDFHIVGGPKEIIQFYSEYSRSEGITNIFFHGRKKASLIPLYLKSFDAVIAPLQFQKDKRRPLGYGLSPLKISQYLAYGCAIVASDIRAHTEVLTDKKNALLAEASNVGDWVNKIELLRQDEALRRKIKEGAQSLYKIGFMPSQRISKILNNFPKEKVEA